MMTTLPVPQTHSLLIIIWLWWLLYARGIYCDCTKSLFLEYLRQIGTDCNEILQGDVGSCGTLRCKPVQIGGEKTAFCEVFLSSKQRIVAPTSRRIPWNLNTKRESMSSWKFSEQNFKIFSEKIIFSEKKLILRFFGGYTCGTHAAALAFTPTANLSIAFYRPSR